MTRAGGSSLDEEIEDEGMDDELVFRSLLQATAIGSFFTTRYLLDVLFTPHAVNALSRHLSTISEYPPSTNTSHVSAHA